MSKHKDIKSIVSYCKSAHRTVLAIIYFNCQMGVTVNAFYYGNCINLLSLLSFDFDSKMTVKILANSLIVSVYNITKIRYCHLLSRKLSRLRIFTVNCHAYIYRRDSK